MQGPERAWHFWRMTTSWTEGGQWRATGHAAEQGKEPEAHFLLHSEPLENFNQEVTLPEPHVRKITLTTTQKGVKAGQPIRR